MRPTILPLLAAALVAGCNYSYKNPAEALSAGEVGGHATVPSPASAAGVSVSVQGSLLDQATRPTGDFGVLPLTPGTHTILLRQGVARAALRQLDLGYGSDGKVEGVWLGDVALPRAVSLTGTLFGPAGTESLDGLIVDETTGIGVPLFGDFKIQGLAVGSHRLIAATRDATTGDLFIGGPVLVTAALSEQGTEKKLADIPVRPATSGTGHLYFRVASTVSGLDPGTAPVHVVDATGVEVAVAPADSNGDRDLTLPEGPYFVEVAPPPAFAATVSAPERRMAVVVADDGFELGTFYLADDATLEAAALSCRADADCAPGTCVAGVCTGYAPPAAAPADVPLCADLQWCPTFPGPCDFPAYVGGTGDASCVQNPVTSLGVCVPCSTRCTLDGVTVLTATACSY